MAINFAAASTAGLNNPGTEIITLVKDGGGNFINPPSYDKMRAYLRSGEVPMLFVTTEGGETGSLYQLVEYSETKNKIRFSNDTTTIAFSAGAAAPVVSEVVPKPLTYDYMPEGYPKKAMGTVTLMEEQELAFASEGGAGQYTARLTKALELAVGQTYTVSWDGTEYECVCYAFNSVPVLGNLSILGAGDNTGEPFLYVSTGKSFITLGTAASHTISVATMGDVITPIDEKYLPEIPADKLPAIPAIHFTDSISANIANETPPVFAVSGLSYSEIYNIAEKGSFLIEDSGTECYIPIKLDISQSGDIFVDIMVIGDTATYARLVCLAGETQFSRYAWWQLGSTAK